MGEGLQIREVEEEDDVAGMDAPGTNIWMQEICSYGLQAELHQILEHFGADNWNPTSCAKPKAPSAHLYQKGSFSRLHGIRTFDLQYGNPDDSVTIAINQIIQGINNDEVDKVLEQYRGKIF